MAGSNLFTRDRGFGAGAVPPVRPEPRGQGVDSLTPVKSPKQLKNFNDLSEYDIMQLPSKNMLNFMMKSSMLSSAFFNSVQLGHQRQEKYREYDLMEDSVLISSFLEMITDDAFQRDAEREASVWVSETTQYKDEIERFLDEVIDIEGTGWGLIYQLAKLGDFFVKPQYEDGEGVVWARMDTYPGNVWRIDINGKLFAFAYHEVGQMAGNPYNESSGETHIVDERGFVHFYVNYRPDFTRTTLVIPKEAIKDVFDISGLDESTLNFSRATYSINDKGDRVSQNVCVSPERKKELFESLRVHRSDIKGLRKAKATKLKELRIQYLTDKVNASESDNTILNESRLELVEITYNQALIEANSKFSSEEYNMNNFFLSNWDKNDHFYFTLSSKYGNSFLFSARRDYKVLNLIEQSLALGRLARSAVARVYYVNTEGASPKERQQIMNWIEDKLTQTETFDKTQNLWKTEYFPYNYLDDIFLPVTGTKGDVKMDQIGGDLDIRHIVDVDHFLSKVFSGLKIPKAYMGFEDSLPGGIGSTTLVRLDIRYARTVKKLQRAFLEGLKRLLQLHLEAKYQKEIGLDEIPLQMSIISGAEESDRWNALSDKLDVADKIMLFVSNNQGDTTLMARTLYDEYFGLTFKENITGKKLFPDLPPEVPEGEEPVERGGSFGGGGPSIDDVKAGLVGGTETSEIESIPEPPAAPEEAVPEPEET
jgi:hypothetical protein